MSPLAENKTESKQNSRIVRVRDLPIYYDIKNDDSYRRASQTNDDQSKINNNNNWLYSFVSQMRQSIQQTWNNNKEFRLRIIRGVETGEAHAKATIDYIHDDETLLPKVGVVTIAGLGGLLLGHKGGPIRKTFYSSVAGIVALSACYPKQSANVLDQVYIKIKNQSKNLFDNETKSNLPWVLQNKHRVFHTTKTENESTITIKGDYGQGTPGDQHFYTTRGTTSVDTEKKM
ncbi:unnamed protein product [Rotaria socialis]|uniref:MICOS complex subunit n=1 Tax=Rotaria socialis TaxID=392032 RepID=A0A817S9L7_9BILA|nr:unnamed protein product [Rotaria socialis]CAF3326946.1 unnamed protein product [Rotaria socialis]CAF3518958.1 unnamed protein product [Rotaria socialis]CAF3606667.1 unnamed protein product [Rotaria socialis]CAF4272154.1 unnamed protein product [Rotaria socialis]